MTEDTNLLEETLDDLSRNGKKPEDVLWVGSYDGEYAMTWDDFAAIANFDYWDGYGDQEVVMDLAVVGRDWWLDRYECEGVEGWRFQTVPTRKKNAKPFEHVRVNDPPIEKQAPPFNNRVR